MAGTNASFTNGYILIIDDPGVEREPLVMIRWDMAITYGPNYTPDAAARTLWEAIATSEHRPHCPGCQCKTT